MATSPPGDLPGALKRVILWLVAGAVVFVGVQWVLHEQAKARFYFGDGVIELHRAPDGHYHWPGTINGRAVDFLVDTGASGVAVPSSLARELDLASEGKARSSTAGGTVVGEVVRGDIALQGGVRAERVRMIALPGLADDPLLGMDVLGRLHWRQENGVLRIDLRSGDANDRQAATVSP